MTFTTRMTAGALAAFVALGTTPVVAQTAQPETGSDETAGTEAPLFADEKIDAFVLAAADMSAVRAEFQEKIQSAQSEEDVQRLAAEGRQKMIEAVEGAEGISLEEYNAIGAAAQEDPELARRITMLIEEQVGSDGNGPAEPSDG